MGWLLRTNVIMVLYLDPLGEGSELLQKGLLGSFSTGFALIQGRFRADPYESYMGVSANWGSLNRSLKGFQVPFGLI